MAVPVSEWGAESIGVFASKVAKLYSDRRKEPLRKIEMFLTDDCTLRCDYCFVKDKEPNVMSWDVAKKAVDYLMENSLPSSDLNITFFGGEPLLQFGLMQRIADYATGRAEEQGKKIGYAVTTNGTIMSREIASFGRKYGFNYLLSVDGNKDCHDRHRVCADGKTGSWDLVMGDNFELLKSIQAWMGARFTIAPDTVRAFSAGVKTLADRGVNQFLFGPDKDAQWTQEEMDILASEYHKVADFYIESKKNSTPIRISEFETPPEESNIFKSMWGCDAGRTRFAISTEGDIFPCSRFVRPFEGLEGYRLGSLDEGLTNIRARMDFVTNTDDARPKCVACDYRDACTGGCPATNLHLTGSLYEPTDFQCFNVKLRLDLLRRVHGEQN